MSFWTFFLKEKIQDVWAICMNVKINTTLTSSYFVQLDFQGFWVQGETFSYLLYSLPEITSVSRLSSVTRQTAKEKHKPCQTRGVFFWHSTSVVWATVNVRLFFKVFQSWIERRLFFFFSHRSWLEVLCFLLTMSALKRVVRREAAASPQLVALKKHKCQMWL